MIYAFIRGVNHLCARAARWKKRVPLTCLSGPASPWNIFPHKKTVRFETKKKKTKPWKPAYFQKVKQIGYIEIGVVIRSNKCGNFLILCFLELESTRSSITLCTCHIQIKLGGDGQAHNPGGAVLTCAFQRHLVLPLTQNLLCTRRSLHHRNASAISILRFPAGGTHAWGPRNQGCWTQTKAVFRDECRGRGAWMMAVSAGDGALDLRLRGRGRTREKRPCRSRVCLTCTWICFVFYYLFVL